MSKSTTKNTSRTNSKSPTGLCSRMNWGLVLAISGFIVFFIIEWLIMRGLVEVPDSINLGVVGFRTYGLLITTGVVLVTYFVSKEIRKLGELKNVNIADALIWGLAFGLIGARLYHVITDWNLYADDPIKALYIWNGGLGIYGAIMGGIFGLWLYSKNKKFKLIYLLDVIALFMPLAQIIGRAGNLINQEILGTPISPDHFFSWYIAADHKAYNPVFLYEQIGNLILFSLLLIFYKQKKLKVGNGVIILLYIAGYCVTRFVVEFFRTETRILFDTLTLNQIVSTLVFVVCFLLWKYKVRNPAE